MGWATKEHQVCLAHLIRDAQYAIDAGDRAFAPKLKALLERACGIGRRRQTLADATGWVSKKLDPTPPPPPKRLGVGCAVAAVG